MEVPATARALSAALPDVPRWLETRSLLLGGDATVRVNARGDAGVVLDETLTSGSLVGRADAALLRRVLAGVPADFELIVQTSALPGAREALPAWAVADVVVHSRPGPPPGGGPAPGVVVCDPPDRGRLAGLPADVRSYAALSEAFAVRVVDGRAVAVCAASDVTETLWDVGIDTAPAHRRRGHAAACFTALAAVLAAGGRAPVWSAYADYPPSLRLAAKLGFVPVDRLAVLSPGPR